MYHYNYDQGISYPHRYNYNGTEGTLLAGPAPCKENQLYGSALMTLDKRTKYNLQRLKNELVKKDPCYAYGMEHWHPDSTKGSRQDVSEVFTQAGWEKPQTFFSNTGVKARECQSGHKAKTEDESTLVKQFCYLCSTLEQHKLHMAKKGIRLKEKKKPKPRVSYIAPPPLVKKKKEETKEAEDVLYKVTIKTAKRADAGTSAKAFIQIHGRSGSMKKRPLTRKRLGNFCFGSGTTESFHFKGPDVGDVKSVTIEHDGLEKKHGWLVDEVEVMNLSSGDVWLFMCGQWLSLFHGDFSIKRKLRGERKEMEQRELEIRVQTANEMFAGTDANVYITLYGKKGSSKKLHLKSKDKDAFEKGKEDVFHMIVDDFGPISNIKIEHDNSGRGPGWRLEKVTITDLGNGKKLLFPCGDWLAEDEGDRKTCRFLYPAGRKVPLTGRGASKGKGENLGPLLRYRVKVLTGGMSYAGTDARVYMLMTGKLGVAREVELENGTDCFEKNQTDIFEIQAEDVGDLKKIKIRHDNSGLGPGWYLEQVKVQRFFSKTEVAERLGLMKAELDENVARRASQAGLDLPHDRTPSKLTHSSSRKSKDSDDEDNDHKYRTKHNRSRKSKKIVKGNKSKKSYSYGGISVDVTESDTSDSSSESDSDADSRKRRTRKMKKHSSSESSDSDSDIKRKVKFEPRRRQSTRLALEDSDVDDRDVKSGRVPHYDEYLFVCQRWLAEDEDDGQIDRTLKLKSVTTFYQMK